MRSVLDRYYDSGGFGRAANRKGRSEKSEQGQQEALAGHFAMRPYRNKPKASICEMISALNVRPFWIFALLVSCTMFVRMLYRHRCNVSEYAEPRWVRTSN